MGPAQRAEVLVEKKDRGGRIGGGGCRWDNRRRANGSSCRRGSSRSHQGSAKTGMC